MTPDALARHLRAVLPAPFEVFEPHENGEIEVFTGIWADDGSGVNVSIELADNRVFVTETGYDTVRRFAWWDSPIGEDTIRRVAETALGYGALVDGTNLRIAVTDLDDVRQAIERMANLLLEVTRLGPIDLEPADSATAAAD